ncbi:MAG: hypothetical protein PHN69_08270, partial [Candidatus Pacebacteria bacterium]|nr:hypothetical protein [Candidatus Paceibacterota bacterium]
LRSMSFTSPQNVVFTMKSFDSSDVVLLDVNSFKTWAGPEAVDFYFNIVRALLWISFLIWVFNKGRNIFSSNDNEK